MDPFNNIITRLGVALDRFELYRAESARAVEDRRRHVNFANAVNQSHPCECAVQPALVPAQIAAFEVFLQRSMVDIRDRDSRNRDFVGINQSGLLKQPLRFGLAVENWLDSIGSDPHRAYRRASCQSG